MVVTWHARHGSIWSNWVAASPCQYPFRERLVGQLIRAQFGAAHAAAALGSYGRARLLLADELGLDPGPELRQLEPEILRR